MIEETNDDRYDLETNSYLTIGSILPSCFYLLQPEKGKLTQPIFVGDSRGILYLVEYTEKGPEVKVKTQPFKSEITCLNINLENEIQENKFN